MAERINIIRCLAMKGNAAGIVFEQSLSGFSEFNLGSLWPQASSHHYKKTAEIPSLYKKI